MDQSVKRSVERRSHSPLQSGTCFAMTTAALALVALALQWAFRMIPGL